MPGPLRAITERLVTKRKLVMTRGATAAKDPPTETKGWATYQKVLPIEAKRADRGGTLNTLEGPARYRRGDWVARGAKGEKWPIRADVFAKTYKRVGKAHGVKEAAVANIRDNRVSKQDAEQVARSIGAAGRVSPKSLLKGMRVEMEHTRDPETDVVKGDPKALGRTAWAHLKESPRYYAELSKMERKLDKKAEDGGATSPQSTSFGVFSPRAAGMLGSPRIMNRFRSGFSEEAAGVAEPEEAEVG